MACFHSLIVPAITRISPALHSISSARVQGLSLGSACLSTIPKPGTGSVPLKGVYVCSRRNASACHQQSVERVATTVVSRTLGAFLHHGRPAWAGLHADALILGVSSLWFKNSASGDTSNSSFLWCSGNHFDKWCQVGRASTFADGTFEYDGLAAAGSSWLPGDGD